MDTIDEIEILAGKLDDMARAPANDDDNRTFADKHAARTAELLRELQAWRENARVKRDGGGRVIVEGFDDDDMNAAFTDALNKASGFFDQHHDIAISVLGLNKLEMGGFHVVLEVDITPMTHRLNEHPAYLDEEMIRNHEKSFTQNRKAEESHLKELVHDHFLVTSGSAPHIPDYFLINFNDAEILNQMIEKQFFKAGQKVENINNPPQMKVRVIKKDYDE
jgi:hypothetical protein